MRRGEDGVERRPHGHDRPAAPPHDHVEPAGPDRPGPGVALAGEPHVGAPVPADGFAEQRLHLVGMPRYVHGPVRQSVDERDVAGCLMGPPRRGRVVRRADAHQHRTHILMTEAELDLLEGPLDEERRIGVDDRPQPREGEPAGDADQQLLADAHVQDAVRVSPPCRLEGVG